MNDSSETKFKLRDFLHPEHLTGGRVSAAYGITEERMRELVMAVAATVLKPDSPYNCKSPNTILSAYMDLEVNSTAELCFLVHYLLNSAFGHYIDSHLLPDSLKTIMEAMKSKVLRSGEELMNDPQVPEAIRKQLASIQNYMKDLGKEKPGDPLAGFHFGKGGEA